MRQHPKNLMSHGGTSLLGIMLVFAVVAALPQAAGAQDRVTPINGSEGVESVVEGRAETGAESRSDSGFAHLDGPAQLSGNRGLRVAGQRILVTNRTSVFPNVNGVSSGLRPRQLSGREVTVFGEITSRGIEAILVIVRPAAGADFSAFDPGSDPNFVPSSTNPRVGHAPNNVEE